MVRARDTSGAGRPGDRGARGAMRDGGRHGSHEEGGRSMSIDARLDERGITLPPLPQPAGNYVHAVRTGNLLFLSGKGPFAPGGGPAPTGKVGQDVSTEEAYQHGRAVGLTLLTGIRGELRSLDRVRRVVKVLGLGNATPDFGQQPAGINGWY